MEKMIELSFNTHRERESRKRYKESANQIFDSKQTFMVCLKIFLVFLRYTQSMFEQSFMVIIFFSIHFATKSQGYRSNTRFQRKELF